VPEFSPTDEQVAIRDGFRTGQNLVINAGAGTGKTASLRLLADEAKPKGQNGIYLAFNKPIAEEAQRRFAGTPVVSRTIHSLAYAEFGAPRQHRMNASKWQRWTDKADVLSINRQGKFSLRGLNDGGSVGAVSAQQLVKLVESAVSGFCHSADTEFQVSHIAFDPAFRLTEEGKRQLGDYVLGYAKSYWNDVVALDGKLKFSHDHYLKMYALSNPELPYDFILLDEAQDTDPLMIGLIESQKNAQVVVVGDRAQAIYGWRGAISAMDAFGGTGYDLSQSFRFGDAIADYANRFLALLGDFRLSGMPGLPSSVFRATKRQPEAILTRTNMGALVELAKAQQQGHSTAIGGRHVPQELRKLAVAAKELHDKGKTNHADLSMFGSWKQVQNHVEEEADAELGKLVSLIDDYGPDAVVRSIDNCVEAGQARTIVSTAHAAKGLEWFQVTVADDFRAPRGDTVSVEEVMLSYVAVTRAQRHLDPLGVEWVETFSGAATSEEEKKKTFAQEKAIAKKAFSGLDIAGITADIKKNRNNA
jgi:superfamily I DNA/RNA helicase